MYPATGDIHSYLNIIHPDPLSVQTNSELVMSFSNAKPYLSITRLFTYAYYTAWLLFYAIFVHKYIYI